MHTVIKLNNFFYYFLFYFASLFFSLKLDHLIICKSHARTVVCPLNFCYKNLKSFNFYDKWIEKQWIELFTFFFLSLILKLKFKFKVLKFKNVSLSIFLLVEESDNHVLEISIWIQSSFVCTQGYSMFRLFVCFFVHL